MTVQDLINRLQQVNFLILSAIFLAPPLIAWIISLMHSEGKGERFPWKYLYSFLVYIVCVPGMLAAVLTAYSVFFVRQNLLQVNVVVYFFPIFSMVVTLILIGKNVDWSNLPGVERLYALMTLIGISFIIALAVERTRIWIVFGGSIKTLIAVALFCFAVLKWSSYMLFRKTNEPQKTISDYTDSIKMDTPYDPAKELKRLRKKFFK